MRLQPELSVHRMTSPSANTIQSAGFQRPPHLEVFEDWARRSDVGEQSVRVYRSMWTTWIHYLAGEDVNVAWHQAKPGDIDGLLEALNHRRTDAKRASHVSRRRYWKVLSRVYEHAKASGWCRSNPTHRARSVPRSEEAASVVLPPAYLDRLKEVAQTAREGEVWTAQRDRALLAVLLDGALTTSELIALRVSQVHEYANRGTKIIRVRGDRPAQNRDLELQHWASAVLQGWLLERERLMCRKAAAEGPLFVSRKGWTQLSPVTVHQLIQRYVEGLEREFETRIAHRGANLVRSSVIALWLHIGIGEAEVLARAGLDSGMALRRLQHAIAENGAEA